MFKPSTIAVSVVIQKAFTPYAHFKPRLFCLHDDPELELCRGSLGTAETVVKNHVAEVGVP
jgi:hypothetical protein